MWAWDQFYLPLWPLIHKMENFYIVAGENIWGMKVKQSKSLCNSYIKIYGMFFCLLINNILSKHFHIDISLQKTSILSFWQIEDCRLILPDFNCLFATKWSVCTNTLMLSGWNFRNVCDRRENNFVSGEISPNPQMNKMLFGIYADSSNA